MTYRFKAWFLAVNISLAVWAILITAGFQISQKLNNTETIHIAANQY